MGKSVHQQKSKVGGLQNEQNMIECKIYASMIIFLQNRLILVILSVVELDDMHVWFSEVFQFFKWVVVH